MKQKIHRRILIIRAHIKRAYLLATEWMILGFAILGLIAIYAQGIETREWAGSVWFWMFYSLFALTAVRWVFRELRPVKRRMALYDRQLTRELQELSTEEPDMDKND